MLVAEGAAEVMLEIGPTLWDLAAPSLIVSEAGGRLTDFAGTPSHTGPQALATNGRLARGDRGRPGRGVSVGRGRWAEVLMAVVPIALAIFTLLVLVEPDVQPAIFMPRLALAIDALATLVAVAVAILGWVRFREGGDEAALWRASALLVLGTINGLMATATILGAEEVFGLSLEQPGQLPLWASVITRGLAGGLLIVAGLVATGRRRQHVRRPLLVLWLPAMVATAAVFLAAGLQESLPPLVTPAGMAALRAEPGGAADARCRASADRGRGVAGARLPARCRPVIRGVQAKRPRDRWRAGGWPDAGRLQPGAVRHPSGHLQLRGDRRRPAARGVLRDAAGDAGGRGARRYPGAAQRPTTS